MSIQIVIGSDAAAPACGSASPATSWLAQCLRQIVAAVLLQRAIRRAEADLMALSDRTLKDIGLSRGEIRPAVRGMLAADGFAVRLSRSARS